MKLTTKLLIVLIMLITAALHNEVYGQVPKGINFQAMARQADGRPVANKQVSVRISIANESATGNKEYVEQHFPTTNALGLFDLVIGKGNLVSGSFSAINWAASNKWIQVELDPNGANNFILMGSQQMMSVPYSLYAEKAGNVINYKGGDGISIIGDEIFNIGDADNDPGNELVQSFQLSENNILTLSDAGGNKTIDLSKYDNQPINLGDVLRLGTNAGGLGISNLANPINNQDAATKIYVDNLDIRDEDADPTNEIQDLELADNVLKISNNESATAINLSAYLDNTDNQNLSLTISGTSRTIAIENGDGVTFNVADNDNDPENEIQDLELNINTLKITNNSTATEIDLSTYLDNTDNQNLSLETSGISRTISIDNGEGVTFNVADNDNDPENEIQDLQLTENILKITNNALASNIDLSAYLDNTDNQTLSLSISGTERTITISGGNEISLDVADNDNSSTNEAQTLSKSGNEISLSAVSSVGGGTVILNDDDPTNEIQNLSLSGDDLNISGGVGVSLSDYRQTISASGTGNTRSLSISGGGNTISLNIADNDSSPTNEAQSLTRTGNTILLNNIAGVGGGSFTLNDFQNSTIINVGYPSLPNDAATKQYVDDMIGFATFSTQMSSNLNDDLNTSTSGNQNNYAFKVGTTYSGNGLNSIVALTRSATGFDDTGLINQNKFVAAVDGVYQFTVNASSTDAGAVLKVRVNGNTINNIMRVNNGLFQESLLFKLNANDYLEILIDQGSNANLSGTFFGYKL